MSSDDSVRAMLWHEDRVFNERIRWLLQFEIFLVAILTFAWRIPERRPLVHVISILGVMVALICLISISWSIKATIRLRNFSWHHRRDDNDALGVIGWPPPNRKPRPIEHFSPWYLLPITCVV